MQSHLSNSHTALCGKSKEFKASPCEDKYQNWSALELIEQVSEVDSCEVRKKSLTTAAEFHGSFPTFINIFNTAANKLTATSV